MSKSTDRKKQVAALEKLRKSGLYSGKIDRRKTPSKYQQSLIKKFDDVIRGRAQVVKVKTPSDFAGIARTTKDAVILPKGKGERWRVNSAGNVVRERKGPRGERMTSTGIKMTGGRLPPKPVPPRRVQYALPFARKIGKGQYRLEWMRFPDWEHLAAFMAEYEKPGSDGKARYGDWRNFVFEEEISELPKVERDRQLTEAAIKYGKAKAEHFEGTSTLAPIMRAGRKARRNKKGQRRSRGR